MSNLNQGHALEITSRMAAQGMSDLAQSLPWGRDESELVTELQSGSDAAFDWLVTYYHAGGSTSYTGFSPIRPMLPTSPRKFSYALFAASGISAAAAR